MKTTVDFLNEIKQKHGLPSDYALAGKLELTRASVSRFMNGKDYLGDTTSLKVADLLDADPAYIMACIHAERAKHSGEKAVWERIAAMVSGDGNILGKTWTLAKSGQNDQISKSLILNNTLAAAAPFSGKGKRIARTLP